MKINLKNSPVMINFVSVGEYLKEDKNIGHELTNFLPSIDGDYFGYIVPKGNIPDEHWEKHSRSFTIVFVAKNDENQWCIICIYLNAKYLDETIDLKIIKYEAGNNQLVPFKDIYAENTDNPYPIYASLKCEPENVLFPIPKNGEEKFVLLKEGECGFTANSSLRKYIGKDGKDKFEQYLNQYEWKKWTKENFKYLCKNIKKIDDMFKKSLLSRRNI